MTPRVGNILFSGPMVRALLDRRKTQTRRLAYKKCRFCQGTGQVEQEDCLQCCGDGDSWSNWLKMHRRFEAEGEGYRELLYVREAFAGINGPQRVAYKADGDNPNEWKWTPSIHMPRWASRLTLEVTGTKLERLQDISNIDARREGIEAPKNYEQSTPKWEAYFVDEFLKLWNSLHGPDSWDANPEVVALTFRVHRCNVDEVTL